MAIANNEERMAKPMFLLASASFVAAPVVTHAVHGNSTNAIASGVMRVGLPLLLGVGASTLADCDAEAWLCSDEAVYGFAGFTTGVLSALVIDQFLARDSHPPPKGRERASRSSRSFSLRPFVQPAARGGAIGLVGAY